MPLDEDVRKTRELAQRLAADRESRMLTPTQIEELRQSAKRSSALLRAELAKYPRPDLDDPTTWPAHELEVRRIRLQESAQRTIDHARAEFAKMPRPNLDDVQPDEEQE